VLQYCVNGIRDKLEGLKVRREQANKREAIMLEKVRTEARTELEMVDYEYNSELLNKQREK
jgi:hypothetical protein